MNRVLRVSITILRGLHCHTMLYETLLRNYCIIADAQIIHAKETQMNSYRGVFQLCRMLFHNAITYIRVCS